MAPETDQLAPVTEPELTDAVIGPTIPRVEVQVVNKTTDRDNHLRRIESIKAELQKPDLSEQERAEALEDLEFSEARLGEVQAELDELTATLGGPSPESSDIAPDAPESPVAIDELSARAMEVARSVNEQASDESYKG